MSLPKFSVVTPSFNQASFIEDNIRSVFDQRYPAIEHIIIDGASNDGTLEILKKYPHLRWISEPDQGQAYALNKGFKMATGEIIGWLNADDSYCSQVFQTVAQIFVNPEVMVLYGDGFEIDEHGTIKRPIISRGASSEALIKYWKWQYEYIQPAFFFRRKVFDEVGYLDEHLYYAMDHDFFIRLSQRYDFHYIAKPLASTRLHAASKTGRTYRKFIPDYIWETHKVSRRYWGRPTQLDFYRNLFSFLGAVGKSILKNLLFVSGSKSRIGLKRILARSR